MEKKRRTFLNLDGKPSSIQSSLAVSLPKLADEDEKVDDVTKFRMTEARRILLEQQRRKEEEVQAIAQAKE